MQPVIRPIHATDARPLRTELLRPLQRPEELVYRGDDAADSLHAGVFLGDELAGIASVCREQPEPDHVPGADAMPADAVWRLRGMALRPGLSGRGAGRDLLEYCFAYLEGRGAQLLWCHAREVAVGFYRQLGLVTHGDVFDFDNLGPHYVMARAFDTRMRPAMADEALALSRLALRSKAHWGYDAAFLDACRAELTYSAVDIASPTRRFVVREHGGRLVGFYMLEGLQGTDPELDALFVEPRHIGQGHGRMLMRHALQEAQRHGAARVTIQGDPHAVPFYRAAGARPAGERESGSVRGRFLPLFTVDL